MDFLSEFVTANGVKLHVRRVRADGPMMLMIHGLTDNGACWARVAAQFTPEYDIVAVDVRAHGLSEAPPSGYSTRDIANDVIGITEALDLGSATFIGHSMGADAAAEVARLRPDLVRQLVLEDPPWSDDWVLSQPDSREQMRQGWLSSLMADQPRGFDQLMESGRQRIPHWDEAELAPWAQSKLEVRPQALDYIVASRAAWQLTVQNLRCRTLLVVGETQLGGGVSTSMADEARGLCPNLEVFQVEGAGHCIHRDQFERYLVGLRRFLEET